MAISISSTVLQPSSPQDNNRNLEQLGHTLHILLPLKIADGLFHPLSVRRSLLILLQALSEAIGLSDKLQQMCPMGQPI